jgi:hypothetical protein
MDGDPNFRLKAVAVLACVAGVFLVVFVAQRFWYWLRTRKRPDVETTRLAPVIDLGLLALGGLVIWLAVEALLLSIVTSRLPQQPPVRRKIAEVEVGRMDADTGRMNLLFYHVDRAGRRITDQRLPVLTSGTRLELRVQILDWRPHMAWLGDVGIYQFLSLGGGSPAGSEAHTDLGAIRLPRSLGARLFLQPPRAADVRADAVEGIVYDIYLDPATGLLELEVQVQAGALGDDGA